jgi:BirA family biotin operon repressor/biotin-[acetyl-CoA-carboxylase] ligase
MIGENTIAVELAASTNTLLHQMLDTEQLPEGTLVVAHHQYNGRGMQNNVWESERGLNLTFSFVLYPDFLDINHLFALNQMVSLALREVLNSVLHVDFKVKWPNDIMFENTKVGGILIENSFRGNQIKCSIIGIGLNVNQIQFKKYTPEASSLKIIAGQTFNLDNLLKITCLKLQEYYEFLKKDSFTFLHHEYHQHLFRHNEEHLFRRNGVYFKGVIKGVQTDGKLLLANDYGVEQIVDIKEIQFVY